MIERHAVLCLSVHCSAGRLRLLTRHLQCAASASGSGSSRAPPRTLLTPHCSHRAQYCHLLVRIWVECHNVLHGGCLGSQALQESAVLLAAGAQVVGPPHSVLHEIILCELLTSPTALAKPVVGS